MERLREHLGIDRWLLYGGSWGSTLILAYAERYPGSGHRDRDLKASPPPDDRRSTGSTAASARFFPEEWERFRAAVPRPTATATSIAAYASLMEDPDPQMRTEAAAAWCRWEDAVLSRWSPAARPTSTVTRPAAALLAFVRICAHYFANRAWLEDGALLRDAGRLAGIPGVLVHGRLDLSCPSTPRGNLPGPGPTRN